MYAKKETKQKSVVVYPKMKWFRFSFLMYVPGMGCSLWLMCCSNICVICVMFLLHRQELYFSWTMRYLISCLLMSSMANSRTWPLLCAFCTTTVMESWNLLPSRCVTSAFLGIVRNALHIKTTKYLNRLSYVYMFSCLHVINSSKAHIIDLNNL